MIPRTFGFTHVAHVVILHNDGKLTLLEEMPCDLTCCSPNVQVLSKTGCPLCLTTRSRSLSRGGTHTVGIPQWPLTTCSAGASNCILQEKPGSLCMLSPLT
jgi:hypothetical protein